MNKLILIIFFMFPLARAQEDDFFSGSPSSLNSACKQNGFSCGECETDLQNDLNALMGRITNGKFVSGGHWGDGKEKSKNSSNMSMAPGVTLEKTLEDIIGLFKKHNPVGDNKLNYVVIGESESLQGTTIKNGKIHPRIMLKSPNSELMVTFNTDPAAKGYKTIEIMRWNGKQGRYEFQELNFGDKGAKPHVDVSGSKCIECHKDNPRPNWDTYRAWAGVVPSRDDMLEMHGKDGEFDRSKGMQPDAKAYLNFLDQVVKDKESGKKTRLSMLDIPFDDKRQMQDYVRAAGKRLTPREQVDLIKKQVKEEGFYRIKHFPDKDEAGSGDARMSFNFDNKTAEWAGPSQFAFDQMLAQNMCKVTTDLKKHPDFAKFKYPMALLMACGREGSMDSVYPESFKQKVMDYYSNQKYSGLADIEPSRKPAGRVSSFGQLKELISSDTEASHKRADDFKFNRHGRFLNKYLTEVEKLPAGKAREQAKYYSEEVTTPTQNNWHAIGDEGGVKGVPESSTAVMTDVRMLLEPFGVKVSHWSLVHGKNNAYNSFSFSDQFELFETQPLWDEIKKEAGSCEELENLARANLASPEALVPEASPASDNVSELQLLCNTQGAVPTVLPDDKLKEITAVMLSQTAPEVKKSMTKCLNCHDTGGDIEFQGLSKFVNSNDDREFLNFLNSESEFYKRPMIEIFQIKLGLMPFPKDKDYGGEMPPTDWKDNMAYAAKHGISANDSKSYRSRQIGTYLTFASAGGNKEMLKAFCEKINNDNYVKDFMDQNGMNRKGASKQ